MKAKIHPVWHEIQATCMCGNSFITASTKESIRVEVCNRCHPYFTGEQRIVDTEGRVERMKRKYNLQ